MRDSEKKRRNWYRAERTTKTTNGTDSEVYFTKREGCGLISKKVCSLNHELNKSWTGQIKISQDLVGNVRDPSYPLLLRGYEF